jgi:hypothetical protein
MKDFFTNLKRWWWYNTDPCNCCGLLYEINRWKDQKLLKWLTPHLRRARQLLDFCREMNGTKLLWHSANAFRVRSRDAFQYYFDARASFFGKVTVTRTQWLDEDGEAQNMFLQGVIDWLSEGEREKPLVKKSEVIFSGWAWTENQVKQAEKELLKHPEFAWDWLGIAERSLVKELGIREADELQWRQKLHDAVIREEFGVEKKWWDLEKEEYEKFAGRICALTPEEAQKLMQKQLTA